MLTNFKGFWLQFPSNIEVLLKVLCHSEDRGEGQGGGNGVGYLKINNID